MRCPLSCQALAATSLAACAAKAVSLDEPRSGWRNSAFVADRDEEIAAAYPKPPVDRGRQKNRALIEGHVRQAGQARVGRFVVNGIDMPLYADVQGRFVKPWAFGPGSNSVDGGGPEIFSTATPSSGHYLIYVNYWGNFNAADYNFDPEAHDKPVIAARITIINNENTPDERQETLAAPLRCVGDLTFIRSIHYGEKR